MEDIEDLFKFELNDESAQQRPVKNKVRRVKNKRKQEKELEEAKAVPAPAEEALI